MASNLFSPSSLFRRGQADDGSQVDIPDELDVGIGVANSDGSFTLSAKAMMDLLMARQQGQAPATVAYPRTR
jgi:hypothetical protein